MPPQPLAQAQCLVQAVTQLSAARDLGTIGAIVRRAARELTGADGATLVLRDGDQCFYADEDAISPLWKGKRFPMAACVSGWVMHNRMSTVIEDIYADARVPQDAYRPTFVQSMAMVPIRASDPLGAIGNYWARRHRPGPADVAALEALANTTAVALENVRLYGELEARVAQRTQQLQVANRELEAFAHAVSHDLRAPLRSIHGLATLIERRSGLAADANALLADVRASAVRMSDLLDALLDLSAASAPLKPGPVHSRALVEGVVQDLATDRPGSDQRILVDDLPDCVGDATLLRQVWHNLLANALKFSAVAPEPRVEAHGTVTATEATFHVRDNGVGFDPALAGDLFRPFHTLHDRRTFPGTGIGLSIVRRIVDRHGGRVQATSQPGKGATFSFSLPKAMPAS